MTDFETSHAIDQLRRNDGPAIRDAFSKIPRVALLAILGMGGLMRHRNDDTGPEARAYHDGMADLALEILTRAGFDHEALLAAAITGSLEGTHHDRSIDDHERRGPILDGAIEPNPNPDY